MIIVTAPIDLIQVGQPLHPLAFKALSLGSQPYIYSETHAAYSIKPEHHAMIDKPTITGLVTAGGDIENLSLFIEIDPEATHHETEDGAVTWAEFAASINHIPQEMDGKFYMEATDGQNHFKASEVIASGLPWFTIAEYKALQPVVEEGI